MVQGIPTEETFEARVDVHLVEHAALPKRWAKVQDHHGDDPGSKQVTA